MFLGEYSCMKETYSLKEPFDEWHVSNNFAETLADVSLNTAFMNIRSDTEHYALRQVLHRGTPYKMIE